jgi:DNA-binding CsgD family transcriptional regulator
MKYSENRAGAGWKVLTARERDVIHPVAEGKSNKLIASELGISMRTVEAHRARIFHKMGVRNAVQLARTVCISPEPLHSPESSSTSSAASGSTQTNDLGWIADQAD